MQFLIQQVTLLTHDELPTNRVDCHFSLRIISHRNAIKPCYLILKFYFNEFPGFRRRS